MEIIRIFDEEELYRRIPEMFFKQNGKVSSAAFQNTTGTEDMSVDLARMTTPETTALGKPDFGVAVFTAGFAKK